MPKESYIRVCLVSLGMLILNMIRSCFFFPI
jgi:hypothetical protein